MVLKPGYRPGELGGYDGSRPRFQSVSKLTPTATNNGSLIAIFSPSLPEEVADHLGRVRRRQPIALMKLASCCMWFLMSIAFRRGKKAYGEEWMHRRDPVALAQGGRRQRQKRSGRPEGS